VARCLVLLPSSNVARSLQAFTKPIPFLFWSSVSDAVESPSRLWSARSFWERSMTFSFFVPVLSITARSSASDNADGPSNCRRSLGLFSLRICLRCMGEGCVGC